MTFLRALFLLTIMLVFSASAMAQQKAQQQPRTIRATVVAENIWNRLNACWHVCGMSLVVKLEDSSLGEFALISVAYMDDRGLTEKGPHWKLVEKTGKWKFKVVPEEHVELKEFIRTTEMETGNDSTERVKVQQWMMLKGSEKVKLPFGQMVPSYSVKVDKFSFIK